MPPEMGMAAVSSPKTAPTGTRKIAPKRNAIIAGTGPPPTTIQSPTCRTQPVPMMAPKPMVKKFQSESVFFIPPLSSTATSAFLSAIVPLLSFLTPFGVTPCAACFAARFNFVALQYGLGAAAPPIARPKAKPRNERRRFWDERLGRPFVLDAHLPVFEPTPPQQPTRGAATFIPFVGLLAHIPMRRTSFYVG